MEIESWQCCKGRALVLRETVRSLVCYCSSLYGIKPLPWRRRVSFLPVGKGSSANIGEIGSMQERVDFFPTGRG